MSPSTSTPKPLKLKIAILINTDEHPYTNLFHASYQSIFSSLSPNSTLSFFHPILAPNTYPNPLHYDLLIVGGGTYVADEEAAWVQNELAFLRKTVVDFPRLKIVGICFGHQKICQAFGGTLGYNKSGVAELGVTTFPLTPLGRTFFGEKESLRLHELHKKEIATMAPGFISLADNNQVCLSESNTILTFQGHQEMSEKMARLLVQGRNMYTEGLSEEEIKRLGERAGEEHDGLVVWRRVLDWVGE